MPKHSKRKLKLSDSVGRFEALTSSHHVRNALGLLGIVKDEGSNYWNSNSKQLDKWEDYCDVLMTFLDTLWERREVRKQPLETAMREYIQEFEHTRDRLHQMLYGAVDSPESDESVQRIDKLLLWVYLTSTYALASTWIDDKQEHVSVDITINLTTGESNEEWNRIEMRVPRKYRRATKRI